MIAPVFLFLSLYYGVCLVILWRGLRRLSTGASGRAHTFSVIIAARNEESALPRCLQSVLAQNIPASRFEVVVVNDRSTDATAAKVEALRTRHANLFLVNVSDPPAGHAPKKHALRQGIAHSRNEILLFTDADCVVPSTWIAAMDRYFDDAVGLTAGPTSYHHSDNVNTLLHGLQAMDFFSHAVVAAGAIGAGFPLNANANNFAVRRRHFEQAQEYARMAGVVSGDDDLLLQAVSGLPGVQCRYALAPEAAVTTEPTPSLRGLWEQRKRWSSKTVYYHRGQVAFLSGIFLYYALILAGLLLSPFFHGLFIPSIAAFCFKTGLDFLLAFSGAVRFQKYDALLYFPLMAILHIPLIVFACLFGVFGKFRWKDGRVGKTVGVG